MNLKPNKENVLRCDYLLFPTLYETCFCFIPFLSWCFCCCKCVSGSSSYASNLAALLFLRCDCTLNSDIGHVKPKTSFWITVLQRECERRVWQGGNQKMNYRLLKLIWKPGDVLNHCLSFEGVTAQRRFSVLLTDIDTGRFCKSRFELLGFIDQQKSFIYRHLYALFLCL